MSEWSNVPVSKTGEVKASAGSNPALSAKIEKLISFKGEKHMERKKFNRGTMVGGLVRIAIAAVAIIIAVIVLVTAARSQDPDDNLGNIFMYIVGGIMVVAAIGFIASGIKMVIDGRKSFIVSRKGHAENGRIIDLTETEVTERNNGTVSNYTIYNLKFEYTDDFGKLCESEEQISQVVYIKLQTKTLVPILVYGERAIFDRKRFEEQNSSPLD